MVPELDLLILFYRIIVVWFLFIIEASKAKMKTLFVSQHRYDSLYHRVACTHQQDLAKISVDSSCAYTLLDRDGVRWLMNDSSQEVMILQPMRLG